MQESASLWVGLGRAIKQAVLAATGAPWVAELVHTLAGVVGILSIILLSALVLPGW